MGNMALVFNSYKEAIEAMPSTIDKGKSVSELLAWWDAAKDHIHAVDNSLSQLADEFISRIRSMPYDQIETDTMPADLPPGTSSQRKFELQRTVLHFAAVDGSLHVLKQQLLARVIQ